MGKYKVLDIFSFLPANVISLEQLEKCFSSAYKVCRCNPLRCGKGEDSEERNN